MATFVLVHGGFQGGWCWQKVTPLLLAAHHDVFMPTLTGLGERTHLLGPAVNLSTHIQDILNLLFYEDLQDVILVGHSYAGMVIAGVTETMPERLRRAIFLDAGVPDDGQTYFDTLSPEFGERWNSNATEMQGSRVYPASPAYWPQFLDSCSITDPADIAWMEPRLTPHPLATMEKPIRLSAAGIARIPGDFIRCTEQPDDEEIKATKAKVSARGWYYHEIKSDHEVMITAPRELAGLLAEIANT